jgi:hypothetical protein
MCLAGILFGGIIGEMQVLAAAKPADRPCKPINPQRNILYTLAIYVVFTIYVKTLDVWARYDELDMFALGSVCMRYIYDACTIRRTGSFC